jgi:hypothetical protein
VVNISPRDQSPLGANFTPKGKLVFSKTGLFFFHDYHFFIFIVYFVVYHLVMIYTRQKVKAL